MTLKSPDHPYRPVTHDPIPQAKIELQTRVQPEHPATVYSAMYPLVVGIFLGFIQSGLFFQLTFTLSSTYSTFLLVTMCWLVGSAIGTLYLAQQTIPIRFFLLLTLIAYAACGLLLLIAPFNTSLAPLYALLIIAIGFYPGVFFARSASRYRARTLFSRENNGFMIGLLIGTLLFMVAGRVVLWVLPLVTAGIIFYMESRLNWRDAKLQTTVLNGVNG